MIPHMPRKYDDMPGVNGLSLCEIVYGRQWHLAGLSYSVPNVSEDGVELFKRLDSMDKRVAKKLHEEHECKVGVINQNIREKPANCHWCEIYNSLSRRPEERPVRSPLFWTSKSTKNS